MRTKQIKKIIVFTQLEIALREIFQENDLNYCCYKNEHATASPIQYINEILLIGRQQIKTNKQIKVVKHYYRCNNDTAILLQKLTDAYVLIYLPVKNIQMPG